MGNTAGHSDAELVTALAAGDLAALRELYDRHATWLTVGGYSGLVAERVPSASWTAVATAGLGLVLLGPAVAVLLAGPDNREPGSLAASLLVSVVVGLMVVPLPWDLAPFDVSAATGGATMAWGAVAVCSAVVLVWAARR
jgi:hypothetical protein